MKTASEAFQSVWLVGSNRGNTLVDAPNSNLRILQKVRALFGGVNLGEEEEVLNGQAAIGMKFNLKFNIKAIYPTLRSHELRAYLSNPVVHTYLNGPHRAHHEPTR